MVSANRPTLILQATEAALDRFLMTLIGFSYSGLGGETTLQLRAWASKRRRGVPYDKAEKIIGCVMSWLR
jgi:hypothetical protein